MTPPPPSLIKAADIRSALTPKTHFLNPAATRSIAPISDMAGLGNELAVNLNVLEPGAESSEIHHHYNDTEWLYILKGSASLLLTPADTRPGAVPALDGIVPALPPSNPVIEEHPMEAGDFVGFKAGSITPGEAVWAHSLRAGQEGVEYLVGGTRKGMDVCVYPLKGKALIIHGNARAEVDADAIRPQYPLPS